jgi:MFS family permease|tara:strand:- start:270 stop:1427 length:1158 start_codon:yes stop_codon:yes gene_type:complete
MNRRLVLVYITGLLIGISYGLHGPLLPIFAKNIIGASYAELGIIGFANFIPYIFFPLFVGVFLNRFNNGYLLSIGVIINSASVYLLSIAQSVPEIMGYRVITGIAHAFFWPPCEAIISNISKGKTRVRNIATFTGFFTTGFMIGPLIGSILLEGFDATYRIIFEIAAYVLVASLVSSLILTKNRPIVKHEKFSLSSLKEIARFPQVILLLIYCTASFGIILSIYPAFLNDRTMTVVDVEILFFIFGMSRILTLAVAGKLAKNTSLTLIIAIFAIAAGLGISFFVDSIIEFALALILLGFGFSIFFPLTLEIILTKTRPAISGTMIGAYETMFGIGWASGPITAGLISQFFGNDAPYLVFFILGIGVAILSISKRRLLEPSRNTNI